MIAINLETKKAEHQILKDYLQQNASEVLAEKINNGVKIEKDGKTLVSKKDFDSFMQYANDEARKQAEKEANFACVKADTVFGWMIHYFEESSIEGKLYNEDGTEYQPPKPVRKAAATQTTYTPPAPKPKPQMSLFDLMGEQAEPEIKTDTAVPEAQSESVTAVEQKSKTLDSGAETVEQEKNVVKTQPEPIAEPIITPELETDNSDNELDDDDFTEEEMQEVLKEMAEEAKSAQIDYETGEILNAPEPQEKEFSKAEAEMLSALYSVLGEQLEVKL